MILFVSLLAAAQAFTVRALPESGLYAGVASSVWIAIESSEEELAGIPTVSAENADILSISEQQENLWLVGVVPDVGREMILMNVALGGFTGDAELTVKRLPNSTLVTPPVVRARAQDDGVWIPIEGADLSDRESLFISTTEGDPTDFRSMEGGMEAFLPFDEVLRPKLIGYGIVDLRSEVAPIWGTVLVSAVRDVPIETEPGAMVSISVSDQHVGNYTVEGSGQITVPVRLVPADTAVKIKVTDDLGNESHGSIPMPSDSAGLLQALPYQVAMPGAPESRVFVRGVDLSGTPVIGPMRCWSSGSGVLSSKDLGEGVWSLALPAEVAMVGALVRCETQNLDTDFRVAINKFIPERLRLQVWPEVLSQDLPLADIRLVAEDSTGERLSVKGVSIGATHGVVTLESTESSIVLGNYQGASALARGSDELTATVEIVPGTGQPVHLDVWHKLNAEHEIQVWGAVSDRFGRPLPGVKVYLNALSESSAITTDEAGLVSTVVANIGFAESAVLEVATNLRSVKRLASLKSDSNPKYGNRRQVSKIISFAQRQGLFLSVDPPVLFNTPGATADVSVKLQDSAGRPVSQGVSLTVSDGELSPLQQESPGSYSAEYTPLSSNSSQSVLISAKTASGLIYSTNLRIEPRPMNRAFSLSGGVMSNFGAITTPYVSTDLDFRTSLLNEKLMVRIGMGWHEINSNVTTSLAEQIDLNMMVLTGTVGVYWRIESSSRSFYAGLLGVVGTTYEVASFGEGEPPLTGVRVFPPGMSLLAGVSQRTLSGEVFIELRPMGLISQGGAVAFEGQVAGLGAVLGYRVLY